MKNFTYRGHEIHARIWNSFCDTYTVDENGNPMKSTRKRVSNDEIQVLWYEFCAVSPETGKLTEYKGDEWYNFEDVKAMIDRSIAHVEKNTHKSYRPKSTKQLVMV